MQLAAGGGGEATAGVSGDAAPCARGQVGGLVRDAERWKGWS